MWVRLFVCGVAAAGLGLSSDLAWAAKPPSPGTWITNPQVAEVQAAWPAQAKKQGVAGHARIDCGVTPQGRLNDCKVLDEAPRDNGFGAAGLSVTSKFVMSVGTKDGHQDPERVSLAFDWRKTKPTDETATTEQQPSVAAKRAAYPAEALKKAQSGWAVFRCTVSAQGLAQGCWIMNESRPSQGFGEAALTLTSTFRFKPAKVKGQAVESIKTESIVFEPEDLANDYDTPPVKTSGGTISDLQAVWPTAAHGSPGNAKLACIVTVQGALRDCRIASESPEGKGFGAAALLIAPGLRFKPATKGGKPVEARYVQGINWQESETSPGPVYRMTTNLPWARAPTMAEVRSAYPRGEADKTSAGRVVLRCALDTDGFLTNCDAVAEDPYGHGFASAAKRLTHSFLLHTDMVDHKLIKSVRINLAFQFNPPAMDATPRYLSKIDWINQPRADAVMEAFPAKAADAGLTEGRASIDCAVHANGQLGECVTRSEEPAAMDFGPAAVQIGQLLVVNPWTDDGQPAEGARVRFSIKFVKAPDPAPPAKPQ